MNTEHPLPADLPAPLSPTLLWLMAAACGISVANVYYNQPLLGTFANYFHAQPWQVGLVATAAQAPTTISTGRRSTWR